jgi:hypothetical protein
MTDDLRDLERAVDNLRELARRDPTDTQLARDLRDAEADLRAARHRAAAFAEAEAR